MTLAFTLTSKYIIRMGMVYVISQNICSVLVAFVVEICFLKLVYFVSVYHGLNKMNTFDIFCFAI